MVALNEFALLSLFMGMAAFFIANFIYIKNPNNQLNQLILIFGYLLFLMNLAEFGYRSAENIEGTLIWFEINGLWPLIPALLLNISLIFTGRTDFLKKSYAYPLLYIPAVIFVIIGVSSNYLIGPIMKEYWGWAYLIGNNPVFYVFAVWIIINAFTAGYLAFNKFLNSHGIERKQALYIFIGLFFSLIISLISEIILGFFPHRFPEIIITTGTLGLIVIAFSVWKYEFPQLTTVIAADKIISSMSNLLILLDPHGKIISVNKSTTLSLGYSEESLKDKNFEDLFPQDLNYYLEQFSDEKYLNELETTINTISGDKIFVLISLTPIYGYRNEILGYICIGTDITKQKKFQEQVLESEFKFRSVVEQTSDGIVLANQDIKIIYWNQAMESLTGIKREEVEGQYYYDIMKKVIPPEKREIMEPDMLKDIFTTTFSSQKISYHIKHDEQEILTMDGLRKSIMTFNFFVKKSRRPLLCTVVRDITESKLAQDKLKSSLEEKEVLLREIHHRVKNNMQIVSSLLNLQSFSVKDKTVLNLFKESQNRVKSMSIIHESLYQSNDLAHIDFRNYIRRLGSELFSSYGMDTEKIRLKTEIGNISLDINSAIPLGLILNELITNSLKYAFPHGEGVITIKFKKKDDYYLLNICDNGVGIPEEIDFRNTSTLGLELVNSLINQLEGEIDLDNSNGAHFHIKFKEVHYEPRL